MLKNYKRTIHIGRTGAGHRLESSVHNDSVMKNGIKLSNGLTIPAMIAGAVVGTLVFSVVFAAILLPLGLLLGIGAWLRLRKLKTSPVDQSIEADYTVITDTEKKDP